MGWLTQTTRRLGILAAASGLSGCGVSITPTMPTVEPSPPATTATPAPVASTPTAVSTHSAAQPAASAANQPDYFREAVNRATSAVAIGQSAQSTDDWQLAANRWRQAVDLMKQVPKTHANYAQAQTKAREYQQHLGAAQQRAAGKPVVATAAAEPAPTNGLVAQIPIQERRGGTPVVSVTLQGQKGSKAFPMLFDTGATGTLITAAMAQEIGVVIVGETQVKIADGSIVSLPVGYVDFIEVGGLRKESMLVAIGGSVGLLGQDVYGEFGIAMGSQVINLHK